MGNFWSSTAQQNDDEHIRFPTPKSSDSHIPLFDQLSHQAPCFPVRAQNLQFIETPVDFYNQLLHGIQNAKNRILLCSLYLGVGQQEQQLVKALHDALSNNGQLKLTIMLDYLRGTRGTKRLSNKDKATSSEENESSLILDPSSSSIGILLPLLQQFGSDRVQIYLYHTPSIGPYLRKVIPERVDEIIGVQHMKCYMFDESMILSGANLSDWYFVDRQDRYVSIQNQSNVCSFFYRLIAETVSCFSYRLTSRGDLVYPEESSDPMHHSKQFVMNAQKTVREFMHREYEQLMNTMNENNGKDNSSNREQTSQAPTDANDTWIFPVIQMGQLKIRHDENVTRSVIEHTSVNGRLSVGSAYFNLTSKYMRSVLNSPCQNIRIITAAPISNGFYTAKGMSGYIPKAYDCMEQHFFNRVQKYGRQNEIKIHEYLRDGWTFHAKGLWLFAPNDQKPCLTIIGSSNFGQRSTERDVEAQIIVLTENEQLKSDMQQEHDRLFKHTQVVTRELFQKPERRIGFFMRIVTKFFFQKFL